MADKHKDKRSPEEYLKVLIDDGVPRDRAERVVEARYGPTDDTNEDRVRRIFSNASRIFGFTSTSPQGPQIRAYLRSYFNANPNYLQTLRGYEEERNSHAVNRILTGIRNDPMRKLLASKGLIARSGIAVPGLKSIEEEQVIAKNQCLLIQGTFDQQLTLSSKLIREKDYLRYFPKMISVLQSRTWDDLTPAQKNIFKTIENTASVKNDMRTLLNGASLPDLHLNWASLAHSLHWINEAEYLHYVHQSFKRLLTPPVYEETLGEVGKLKKRYLNEILSMKASEFSPQTFTGHSGLSALALLPLTEPTVHREVARTLKTSTDLRVKIQAAETLEAWKTTDPEALYLAATTLGTQYLEIFRSVTHLIEASRTQDTRVHLLLAKQWRNSNADYRLEAFMVLSHLYPKDPTVLRELSNGLKDRSEDVKFLVSKILRQAEKR